MGRNALIVETPQSKMMEEEAGSSVIREKKTHISNLELRKEKESEIDSAVFDSLRHHGL